MIDTRKRSLLIPINSLIERLDKDIPVYEPDNWKFKAGLLSALMNYSNKYQIKHFVIFGNIPNLKLGAIDKQRFRIFFTEVLSTLNSTFSFSVTQKVVPIVLSYIHDQSNLEEWKFPNTTSLEYIAKTYNLSLRNSTILCPDHRGPNFDNFIEKLEINNIFLESKFIDDNYMGKFNKN